MLDRLPDGIVIGAWIGFLVYWWAIAGPTKSTVARESLASGISHRVPVTLAAILLISHWDMGWLGWRWIRVSATVAWSAVVIMLAGLAVALWARVTIGGNWSSGVTLKAGHELIQRGPYRWVRNPIYTGLLMMFAATALLDGLGRGLLALALAFLGFWIKLGREEQFMQRQFPDAYPAYRRRVKALIPYLL